MARRRLGTPTASPQKEKYGDRFIPSRAGTNWQTNVNMIQVRKSDLINQIVFVVK
jgi:hypothetical protein